MEKVVRGRGDGERDGYGAQEEVTGMGGGWGGGRRRMPGTTAASSSPPPPRRPRCGAAGRGAGPGESGNGEMTAARDVGKRTERDGGH